MVAADAAYSAVDIDLFRALDDLDLLMIEQPLASNDLDGLTMLQAAIATPVCLDETAESVGAVHEAIERGGCRIVNLKIQRLGGLGPALAVHDDCMRQGVACWVGTMPELGVGRAQGIHLAALPNCRYPTDIEPSRPLVRRRLRRALAGALLAGPSERADAPGAGLRDRPPAGAPVPDQATRRVVEDGRIDPRSVAIMTDRLQIQDAPAATIQFRVWHLALLVLLVAIAIRNIQDQGRTEPTLIGLAIAGFLLYGYIRWLGSRFLQRFAGRFGKLALLIAYLVGMAAFFLVATWIYLAAESVYGAGGFGFGL